MITLFLISCSLAVKGAGQMPDVCVLDSEYVDIQGKFYEVF